jgi:chlorobactene glucosyltransferase
VRLVEDILFPIYVAVGPVAWGVLSVLTILGTQRMNRLRRPGEPLPNPPPVTVLIPAKDEEGLVAGCLESVARLDYPDFHVIAIDDRSTDRTGPIMDEFAARDSRFEVIHIPHGGLPEGWLGKCHALHTGAARARGKWLLFVDADVELQPDALRVALGLAEAREYQAVSILTHLICNTWWERLILPLAAGAWTMLHTVSLTNSDSRKRHAAANGQFMLIRRDVYEAVGGHEAVKAEITEDVELFRLLKSRDHRVRLFMGRDFAATRMYDDVKRMFHGWGRIFSGTARRSPWRIVIGLLFVLLCGLSVYPALGWGIYRLQHVGASNHTWGWFVCAALHLTLLTAIVGFIYRSSGNSRRWALAFPLAAGALLAIFAFALHKCFTGKTNWRGTTYQAGTRPQWAAKEG